VSSINFGDKRITGPNGFQQLAAFYGVDANTHGPTRDATYFVSPPGGTWDAGDNGVYTMEIVLDQVTDTSGKPVAGGVIGTFEVSIPGPESTPADDMTEDNASDWLAWAQDATAATFDDATRKTRGNSSVRFETTGGFDTLLRYEPANGARWDLTNAVTFSFEIYAENPSPVGFQMEPIVRLVDLDGKAVEYRYWRNGSPYTLWSDARGSWLSVDIPLDAADRPSTGWRRTGRGAPDWSRIRTVEIHADTWDSGFTLWFDDMHFVTATPGDADLNGRVELADFVALANHYGQAGHWSDGDFDRTGQVDFRDFVLLANNFGSSQETVADLPPRSGGWTPKTAFFSGMTGQEERVSEESDESWASPL
jgi:hypothetical protein